MEGGGSLNKDSAREREEIIMQVHVCVCVYTHTYKRSLYIALIK